MSYTAQIILIVGVSAFIVLAYWAFLEIRLYIDHRRWYKGFKAMVDAHMAEEARRYSEIMKRWESYGQT